MPRLGVTTKKKKKKNKKHRRRTNEMTFPRTRLAVKTNKNTKHNILTRTTVS